MPSQAAALPQHRDNDGVLLKPSHPARGQVVGQVENADASLRLPRAVARAADCWCRAQSCAFDKPAQFFVSPVFFILGERLAERASCADDYRGFAALRAQPGGVRPNLRNFPRLPQRCLRMLTLRPPHLVMTDVRRLFNASP